MSGSSRPWLKFHPGDWRADQALRLCSLAARGLWIEMICIMHEAEPYGHLVINGRPVTEEQLCVLAAVPQDSIADLLGELEKAGVFSRARKGVIYSRRMTRDEKRIRNARKNGARGGNPTLCNSEGNSPSDNLQNNQSLIPKNRELRTQSTERTEAPDGAVLDFDAALYRRGKEVLGSKSSGLITKLKSAFGIEGALKLIETASSKQGPVEYVNGALRRRAESATASECLL